MVDNLDLYNYNEAEKTRRERIHKRQENEEWINKQELPFYMDGKELEEDEEDENDN